MAIPSQSFLPEEGCHWFDVVFYSDVFRLDVVLLGIASSTSQHSHLSGAWFLCSLRAHKLRTSKREDRNGTLLTEDNYSQPSLGMLQTPCANQHSVYRGESSSTLNGNVILFTSTSMHRKNSIHHKYAYFASNNSPSIPRPLTCRTKRERGGERERESWGYFVKYDLNIRN